MTDLKNNTSQDGTSFFNQVGRHIPNALTCGNLLSGTAGIICSFTNPEIPTEYFVWIACVFDFFDGFAARMLKVSSPIGKELDSLADMVSFGVLPGLVMKNLLANTGLVTWAWIGLLITVFSALRLAKFNIDTRQSDSFIGLPTPANAIFICGIPALIDVLTAQWIGSGVLIYTTVMFSWLMVSEIPLFALKFKNFTWADNKIRFTFLACAVLLIAFFKSAGLPLAILLYIVFSLVLHMRR